MDPSDKTTVWGYIGGIGAGIVGAGRRWVLDGQDDGEDEAAREVEATGDATSCSRDVEARTLARNGAAADIVQCR